MEDRKFSINSKKEIYVSAFATLLRTVSEFFIFVLILARVFQRGIKVPMRTILRVFAV